MCFYSQAVGLPLVGCPRLLIQYIRSYPPTCRPFLHPQHEDAPCRGDREPLGTPRLIWQHYIKLGSQEVGCGGMDWIELAKVRDMWRDVVNAVMNVRVPKNAGNFMTR